MSGTGKGFTLVWSVPSSCHNTNNSKFVGGESLVKCAHMVEFLKCNFNNYLRQVLLNGVTPEITQMSTPYSACSETHVSGHHNADEKHMSTCTVSPLSPSSQILSPFVHTVIDCPCCRALTKSSSAKADDVSSKDRSIRRVASTYTRNLAISAAFSPGTVAVTPHLITGTVAPAGTTEPRTESAIVG